MKTSLILPIIILGVTSLSLSASVLAETYTYTERPVVKTYQNGGLVGATGSVLNGTAEVVGGVVNGSARVVSGVLGGPTYVTTATRDAPEVQVQTTRVHN